VVGVFEWRGLASHRWDRPLQTIDDQSKGTSWMLPRDLMAATLLRPKATSLTANPSTRVLVLLTDISGHFLGASSVASGNS